jgi:hypothetical protein
MTLNKKSPEKPGRFKEQGEPAPAGFRQIRVHDLKHTFGRRLRAAGVSFEDRQDLLGHRSGRITTHYSQAELTSLIEAAEKVCDTESRKSPARFSALTHDYESFKLHIWLNDYR